MHRRNSTTISEIDSIAVHVGPDNIRDIEAMVYKIIRVRVLGETDLDSFARKTGFRRIDIVNIESGKTEPLLEYRIYLAMLLRINMRVFSKLVLIITDMIYVETENQALWTIDCKTFMLDEDFIELAKLKD